MIIGITGGTGCGKTTLLEVIRRKGGLVLDCDAVYHRLLREDPGLLQAISHRFPGTLEAGVLNRKKLGSIVFSDNDALEDLNRITHGAVKQAVLEQLEGFTGLAAIDAIGLFEGGLAELCDVTAAVTAPEQTRVERLMARDGIDRDYALSRIRAQKDESYFRSLCDYVLENNGTREEFEQVCRCFLEGILD